MKKKLIIVIIFALLIIIVGLFMMLNNEKPMEEKETYNDLVNKIIKKIDNKESFNIYLYSPTDRSDISSVLDYYEDAFSIKSDKLEMKFNNEIFKTLLTKVDVDIVESDDAFIIIKNGVVDFSINGLFSENNVRNLLIKAGKIDPEYKDIDYLVNDSEFESYYARDEVFNILYVNSGKDLFKYRLFLAKNKIKSLIMYSGRLDSIVTTENLEKEVGVFEDSSGYFPMLIKIRNHKIISSKFNISLDDFKKEVKN